MDANEPLQRSLRFDLVGNGVVTTMLLRYERLSCHEDRDRNVKRAAGKDLISKEQSKGRNLKFSQIEQLEIEDLGTGPGRTEDWNPISEGLSCLKDDQVDQTPSNGPKLEDKWGGPPTSHSPDLIMGMSKTLEAGPLVNGDKLDIYHIGANQKEPGLKPNNQTKPAKWKHAACGLRSLDVEIDLESKLGKWLVAEASDHQSLSKKSEWVSNSKSGNRPKIGEILDGASEDLTHADRVGKLVVGDFNEFLSDCEKTGGQLRHRYPIDNFREVLDSCGLEDLGFTGPSATHLEYWHSDHQPFVMEVLVEPKHITRMPRNNNKRFHFEACSAENEECKKIVESCWNTTEKQGIENVVKNYFNRLSCSAKIPVHDIERVTSTVPRRLSVRSNGILNKDFSTEEIRSAMFDMAPSKAPGTDGLPTLFYQKF
ncbi:hypothetical protein Dsin_019045 [Dipteronia sinensis]|uniref:Endonuclease/exonuclease/phosphatase domain-containing protein n=1 Tax=Dipteronia sinensis TaxID=43782 RepID=A0AAE0A799_9ROSI|nr:hypothetical protein Dsin_019045 [Dipteronia sinensis]